MNSSRTVVRTVWVGVPCGVNGVIRSVGLATRWWQLLAAVNCTLACACGCANRTMTPLNVTGRPAPEAAASLSLHPRNTATTAAAFAIRHPPLTPCCGGCQSCRLMRVAASVGQPWLTCPGSASAALRSPPGRQQCWRPPRPPAESDRVFRTHTHSRPPSVAPHRCTAAPVVCGCQLSDRVRWGRATASAAAITASSLGADAAACRRR